MLNVNKLQRLQKRSEDALKVFKNTIDRLGDANKEVRFAKQKELEKLAKTQEQIDQFEAIEKQNENFMNKLNKLFED
jgi:hypothetical protein